MTKITLQVAGIELIKQGTNSNGPWHLYRIVDSNGKKCSTFLEGLMIGETYDFLAENKPFKGTKDGKMHDSWSLTGFDNVAYENRGEVPKKERPAVNPPSQPSRPAQVNSGQSTGVATPDEILQLLKENTKTLEAIKTYLSLGQAEENNPL